LQARIAVNGTFDGKTRSFQGAFVDGEEIDVIVDEQNALLIVMPAPLQIVTDITKAMPRSTTPVNPNVAWLVLPAIIGALRSLITQSNFSYL